MWAVIHGDAIASLAEMEDNQFDSIVTDPPYGLEFMGKAWDKYTPGQFQNWCEQWARECLRVLKPGGYLAAFGGTRTYHRLAAGIEDAGFEIRDSLHWIYGSGFPKSLDVSKAIDKAAGATDASKQWSGWGTALKPAHEPIVLARKPLAEKTVAANVLEWGMGGINVDGCRVGTDSRINPPAGNKPGGASYNMSVVGMPQDADSKSVDGRWPPNILLAHSPLCELDEDGRGCVVSCPVAEMDRQSGVSVSRVSTGRQTPKNGTATLGNFAGTGNVAGHDDTGGASRFFPCFRYNAKASKKERPMVDGVPAHPTVKPVALMRWLAKLVTPPGGTVLDLFAGTGTTGEACELEGFNSVLIEQDENSIQLISFRMSKYEVPEVA